MDPPGPATAHVRLFIATAVSDEEIIALHKHYVSGLSALPHSRDTNTISR